MQLSRAGPQRRVERLVDHCQHVCRYEFSKVVKCCCVDSGICPDVEDSSLRIRDHAPRTQRRENTHSIVEVRCAITNSFGASAQG